MAQGFLFTCNTCAHSIEAWDDGNPYYFESVVTNTGKVRQKKKYAYHPDSLRDQCVGNDSPHLCLSCGKKFMVDSEKPIRACRKCKSEDIVDTYELAGKPCPYCEGGVFDGGPCGIS